MQTVTFRFYEELNDFLPPPRRKKTFPVRFRPRNSVKDMIESLGVPHTEIDLILVNERSVDFTYIVRPEDRISVYPMFESFDISSLNRLRPAPLRQPRFVLDTHLGKLAKYMRLLGFDTIYGNKYNDNELAEIATVGERRILLTRDHGLLKRKQISHGYFVRSTDPGLQVAEILARFDLTESVKPFSRCVSCNGTINAIEKTEIGDRVPPGVLEDYDHFKVCDDCRKIYWRGSHYRRMLQFIDKLIKETGSEG